MINVKFNGLGTALDRFDSAWSVLGRTAPNLILILNKIHLLIAARGTQEKILGHYLFREKATLKCEKN